jgi:mannose-1-phosphate guanylyltransferase
VKAVVLVGGEGTRLRPLTFTTPKQLLPVAGRPMIERVVDHLARHGIDEAVLSMGYQPDAFLRAYPDGCCAGVKLTYATEPEPLDTAGGIAFAARRAGIAETFVAVNGDVLTELDLTALVNFHHTRAGAATIALTPVDDPSRFGVVVTEGAGRVLAFIEKPPRGEAPTNLINAGTYVLEPSVLDRIPSGRRASVEREVFPSLVSDGALFALASEATWVDAGTPATYLEANLRMAALHPEGRVGEGVVVDRGATVTGSVLGAGVVIGPGARVEEAVLLDHAVVGAGALVRRSIVGAGAVIGRNATVEDLTVLGDGATVDAGAELRAASQPAGAR